MQHIATEDGLASSMPKYYHRGSQDLICRQFDGLRRLHGQVSENARKSDPSVTLIAVCTRDRLLPAGPSDDDGPRAVRRVEAARTDCADERQAVGHDDAQARFD